MTLFPDHSLRLPLTEELHSRPFTPIVAPAQIIYLAFYPDVGAGPRDPAADLAHLNSLLAHHRLDPVPADGAGRGPNFHMATQGSLHLKWERHTEFVSYMLTFSGPRDDLFQPRDGLWPADGWFQAARGRIISASCLEVVRAEGEGDARALAVEKLSPCFDGDSLAMCWTTERTAVAMGDFRIDSRGFTRFAVAADRSIGQRRLGRISQRLIEMETYRVLAMTALPIARGLGAKLSEIERTLSDVTRAIALADDKDGGADPEVDRATLATLTSVSADLERISAETAYRFSAARAYEAIVDERIEVLRESRLDSRQTFKEFMVRRFKPALRTVRSVDDRLAGLSARGERAANLLRTRIDVSLSSSNQALLASMDKRAQLQLRLQQTVEGLSVVAISYYAVSLAGYVLGPIAEAGGSNAKTVTALVALPIVFLVYWMVQLAKKSLKDKP